MYSKVQQEKDTGGIQQSLYIKALHGHQGLARLEHCNFGTNLFPN